MAIELIASPKQSDHDSLRGNNQRPHLDAVEGSNWVSVVMQNGQRSWLSLGDGDGASPQSSHWSWVELQPGDAM